MHQQFILTLDEALETDDALTLPGALLDPFRFSPNGHVIIVGTARYVSPTDFTIACNGRGVCTVTWLNVATVDADTEVFVGVALLDSITGSTSTSSGEGGGGELDDEILAKLDEILTSLETSVTGLPPTTPEGFNGPNGVQGVKVTITGADTISAATADSDEVWDVVGWSLDFTAATTLTVSCDDDDATKDFVFPIPAAGIWDLDIVDYARFTSNNTNEPVRLINTAGNVSGIIYLRKRAA